MSTFCLVHGTTQSPYGWALLVSELESLGHKCVCADLPTDTPDAGALKYAEIIGSFLKDAGPAIVVAHSGSGLFLPLTPQFADVERLVYLAAVIPQIGKSLREQFQSAPDMFQPGWAGKDPTRSHELAMDYLFHDCSTETAEWAMTTLRLMNPLGAIVEVSPMQEWPRVPSSYISCRDDRTINPDWWENTARERLNVEPVQLPGGHAPYVSRPADLARVLSSL